MNLSASRRTWEEASSPAAVRLARKYEQEWRDSEPLGKKPDLGAFLNHAGTAVDGTGAWLAILRTDMALRWDVGEKVSAQWYLDRYRDLGEDTIVALIYEEFCLKEEGQERPEPADFLVRFPNVAVPLKRVLEIHELIGSGTVPTTLSYSSSTNGTATSFGRAFPEAGQTIADFALVEELGRGAFARVFLAKERELADRPVALKVSRRGSRQTAETFNAPFNTPISYRCTRTGSTRRPGFICFVCPISGGSPCLACWPTPRCNPRIREQSSPKHSIGSIPPANCWSAAPPAG